MGMMRKHGSHRQFQKPRDVVATEQRCERLNWRPFNGRCFGDTGPRRFPTRSAARTEKHTTGHGGTLYRCDDCGAYHLCYFPPAVLRAIAWLEASLDADRARELARSE